MEEFPEDVQILGLRPQEVQKNSQKSAKKNCETSHKNQQRNHPKYPRRLSISELNICQKLGPNLAENWAQSRPINGPRPSLNQAQPMLRTGPRPAQTLGQLRAKMANPIWGLKRSVVKPLKQAGWELFQCNKIPSYQVIKRGTCWRYLGGHKTLTSRLIGGVL